jgi:hypothetical protein
MAQAPSVGTLTSFALDTVNPPTHKYEYKSFSVGKRSTVLSTDGIRGTRSHPVERTRTGTYTVSGSIVTEPGPADLDVFLNLICGGLKQGDNTFPLTETLPLGFIGIDRIAQMHLFTGCAVDKATFKASAGTTLELTMDIEGKSETLGVIPGFSALAATTSPPYVLMDSILTYGGTAYQYREVEIVIDNAVKKDRFMNSISRTDIPALDRNVGVTLSLPYTTDQIPLYDQNATQAAVLITFTNGLFNLIFNMPAVQFPTQPPETPGRDEVLLPLAGVARKTGGTLELLITNKSA